MKKFIIPLILSLFPGFSCSEEDAATPDSYSFQWVVSEFSKYGSNFFDFRTGDENTLYAKGYVNGLYGVHKADAGQWETVLPMEPGVLNVQNFTVFDGNVYMVSSKEGKRSLWRADKNSIEK